MEATFDLAAMTDEEVINLLGGDLDRLRRLIRDAEQRDQAFASVRDELTAAHPNRYIAWSVSGRVLASSKDPDEVLSRVDSLGVSRDDITFAYLDPDPPSWKL